MLDDHSLAGGNNDVGSVAESLEVELELDTSEVCRGAVLADRKRAGRVLKVSAVG